MAKALGDVKIAYKAIAAFYVDVYVWESLEGVCIFAIFKDIVAIFQ